MSHKAFDYFTRKDLPRGIVAQCKLCKHSEFVLKAYKPGRGWGMREGNKQNGRMIQHIKQVHAEVLT